MSFSPLSSDFGHLERTLKICMLLVGGLCNGWSFEQPVRP